MIHLLIEQLWLKFLLLITLYISQCFFYTQSNDLFDCVWIHPGKANFDTENRLIRNNFEYWSLKKNSKTSSFMFCFILFISVIVKWLFKILSRYCLIWICFFRWNKAVLDIIEWWDYRISLCAKNIILYGIC